MIVASPASVRTHPSPVRAARRQPSASRIRRRAHPSHRRHRASSQLSHSTNSNAAITTGFAPTALRYPAPAILWSSKSPPWAQFPKIAPPPPELPGPFAIVAGCGVCAGTGSQGWLAVAGVCPPAADLVEFGCLRGGKSSRFAIRCGCSSFAISIPLPGNKSNVSPGPPASQGPADHAGRKICRLGMTAAQRQPPPMSTEPAQPCAGRPPTGVIQPASSA
jgi:hypothetical protein